MKRNENEMKMDKVLRFIRNAERGQIAQNPEFERGSQSFETLVELPML